MAYITDLDVSTNPDEEKILEERGFTKVNVNINTGTKARNNVYLWFKKGNPKMDSPVTRVQITYTKGMEAEMEEAGYVKINKNLNAGTDGVPLYMWYSKATGPNDVPVVAVDVTASPFEEANKMMSGGIWEAVNCDLNLGVSKTFVYAWLQREKPIYIDKVTATDNYELHGLLMSAGYTRVDVGTNLGPDGDPVFIWYRKTTDEKKSLSYLNVSMDGQQWKALEEDGYNVVNVNLNKGTWGHPIHLWYKKEDPTLMTGIFLLRNLDAVDQLKAAGVKVIEKDLNEGNPAAVIYVCYV